MSALWPMIPLGEILAKSEEWITLDPQKTYREVTVRLWGKGVDLRREVIGAEIAAAQRLAVRAGQFIASRIDARNGAFGLVPEKLDGAVVSTDFPTFTINDSRLEPRFLNWLSKTRTFVELCKAASEGTTNRVRLKEDRFLATPIALPPLTEQRRIVARIEALAGRIEEAKRLRDNSIDEIGTFASSLHLQISGAGREPIDIFLELHEDKVAVTIGQSYPQVGVKGFGQGLFPKESVGADQTTYKTFNRLYAGAVVLSQVKGWEGAIAVCPPELAGRFASPEYRTFRCVEGRADPDYLAALFATPWFWEQLKDVTRGVGARRERIRPEHFLRLKMPMPSLDAQRKAVMIFAQVQKARPIQAETAAELDALLPSILDKAFKGEL